jgi:hypothetical protein
VPTKNQAPSSEHQNGISEPKDCSGHGCIQIKRVNGIETIIKADDTHDNLQDNSRANMKISEEFNQASSLKDSLK